MSVRNYFLIAMLTVSCVVYAGPKVNASGDDAEYVRKQNSEAAEEFYNTNALTGFIMGVALAAGAGSFKIEPDAAQGLFASCAGGLGASAIVYYQRDKENPGRKHASQVRSVGTSMLATGLGFGLTHWLLSLRK